MDILPRIEIRGYYKAAPLGLLASLRSKILDDAKRVCIEFCSEEDAGK